MCIEIKIILSLDWMIHMYLTIRHTIYHQFNDWNYKFWTDGQVQTQCLKYSTIIYLEFATEINITPMYFIQIRFYGLTIFPPNNSSCWGCKHNFVYCFCLSTSFKHVVCCSNFHVSHIFLFIIKTCYHQLENNNAVLLSTMVKTNTSTWDQLTKDSDMRMLIYI